MSKYRLVGQRYLGFCLRAYDAGRDEAFERWAISFTDEQWSLLGDVAYELDASEGSSQDSGYVSNRGEDEDDDEDGEDGGKDDEDDVDGGEEGGQ
ncbi:hypothetical protein NKR23_g12350 [Pleurostoma richardsiae]|uniref:Uncharacterized protein n=1 Tax=Pleurostoma richardsiae TaxID=41990 RepID=A0AA38RGE8_9PEZI|nr:hypothetical protein NKR23_g12350 [Pleurostoma richardsiae]